MGFDAMSFVLGIILGGVGAIGVLFALAGGNLAQGLSLGRKAKSDTVFAKKLADLLLPPPPPPPAKPDGTPLHRVLAILQRESRLVDFLLEEIAAYSDDQIGSSVRDIHRKAQAALKEALTFEPVLAGEEGWTVTVRENFNPSAIRLIGNVAGNPPFTGTLQHHGWRVTAMKLPTPPAGQDEFVLQPAEVELPGG